MGHLSLKTLASSPPQRGDGASPDSGLVSAQAGADGGGMGRSKARLALGDGLGYLRASLDPRFFRSKSENLACSISVYYRACMSELSYFIKLIKPTIIIVLDVATSSGMTVVTLHARWFGCHSVAIRG